ncbi:hypothetical protein JCM10213_008979 [Rhodosporidiobolus nylandii]
MSAQQPRITLRPPPHRDFLTGYPGIPASDPASSATPTPDPLFPLPVLLRQQAHLSGTVEIRSPPKGPPVRARWLSVELEKVECVPPPPTPAQQEGGKKDAGTKKDGRYVELIGQGPCKLWESGEGIPRPKSAGGTYSPRKKGLKGMLKGKGEEEDDEDGFDLIPDGNYPFKIPLPEGLPPSTETNSKLNGVSYQIVASLCCRGKKGLLKGPAKPAIFVASAPVHLDKADLLGWPVYQPVLPTPLPPKLPWAAPPGELTVGETRESKLALHRDDGTAGEVWMKATRQSAAFGPGDSVQVFVQIGWGGNQPVKLTRLDMVLRETLTYRYPSPTNPSYIIRAPPKVSSLFTANASVSPDSNEPSAFAILYAGEPVTFDMSGLIPSSHSRVTVRTAKHVDVAYHLKLRAMIEGGDEIAVDNWAVVVSSVNQRTAKGIMHEIGWVEGLCERPGLPGSGAAPASTGATVPSASSPAAPAQTTSSPFPPSPSPAQPPPAPSHVLNRSYVDSATEKARLLDGSYLSLNGGSYHVQNPSATRDHTPPIAPEQHTAPLAAPAPVRPTFVPPPSAEEEKRRAYEEATRSRDVLQSSLRSAGTGASPTASGTGDSAFSPTAEDEKVALHQAAVLRRNGVQAGFIRDGPVRAVSDGPVINDNTPLVARAQLAPARSNTMMALSGSDVSVSPPAPTRSPPTSPGNAATTSAAALLGRSLTTAEAEKRRLFLDAKETARRRQEEARLELERQNQLLAEMEFEEAQNAYEDRLIAEAELEQRTAERARLEAFETAQRERIRAEEEQWRREEEERRARALAELDDKKRRAEQAMQAELRRFEEQQRAAEMAREEEIARQAAERKAEDDAKKAMAAELRRQDEERAREEEERRLLASRKAEMERQRAEDERRRREGEEARLADIARRQREEEQARLRWEAEERRRQEEEHYRQEQDRLRREEDDRRRQQEAELAAAAEAARRREAEEARRTEEQEVREASEREARATQSYPNDPYSHPAYPNANGHSVAPARHIVGGIERAPSVASFAPSMSAATATADYYAQSLAPSMSEEKAAYLRQLRAVSSPLAGRTLSQRRPSQPQPPITPYASNPSDQASLYHGYQQPAYPQPPQPPAPPAHPAYPIPPNRQNSYTPASSLDPAYPLQRSPSRYEAAASESAPPVPPAPSSSATSTYKTAAEEKEEAAARRRAEDARAAQPAIPEEEDLPPSYPVQGSATSGPRSAAEEKAELQSYYAAKAAVDAQQRHPPPPPPARADTARFDHPVAATPAPSYQPSTAPAYPSSYSSSQAPQQPQRNEPVHPTQFPNGNGAASAPQPAQHTPQESESSTSHEARDPAIAAGKRVQRSASGSLTASNEVQSASAPAPPLPPQPPTGYAYTSPPSPLRQPQRQPTYADDLARQDAQRALGDVAFGSFNIDESFPEFEQLSGQIAAANAARAASQVNGGSA